MSLREDEDEDEDNRPATFAPRSRKRRHSYSLKLKFQTLKQIDIINASLSLSDPSPPTLITVLLIVEKNTGIPHSVLDKWWRKKTQLVTLFNDKKVKWRAYRKIGQTLLPRGSPDP